MKNMPLRKTTSSLIQEFKKKHGDKYDYSQVEYKGCCEYIKIVCKKHGVFEQNPSTHLYGKGCPACGIQSSIENRRSNTDKYIKKVNLKHNNFFNYDKLEYKTALNKVIVTCPIHGDFEILANSHLNGTGCKSCYKDRNGFGRSQFIKSCKNEKAYLYIIKCWGEEEQFYKIGITGKSVKVRFECKSKFPYNYEIIKIYENTPTKIFNLEKRLHKKYKKYSYKPLLKFKGGTECFLITENILDDDFGTNEKSL